MTPTIRIERGGARPGGAEVLLVPVFEGSLAERLRRLGRRVSAPLQRRAKRLDFRGRSDETLAHNGETTIVLLGLGTSPANPEAWRRAGARGRQEAERQKARRVVAHLGTDAAATETVRAFSEGFLLAGYRFSTYASKPGVGDGVRGLTIRGEGVAARGAGQTLGAVAQLVTEVFRSRDLVNEPPSVATPRFLGEEVRRLARSIPHLEAEVWGLRRIEREKLAGLLAVSRGSREEPRFIVLRYAGRGAVHRVALVGKAITFDSGGLSLKPPKSMETMKHDMAGGAAVIGAVAAAARLGLPVEVTGYVPASENLPGDHAQKPGDVIRYANGKTVEVLNTDAEGRLILADGLMVASRTKPDALIDLATLTGACRVALGTHYAGIMGTDQALIDALLAAGRASGEGLWQLPLAPEYRDDLKSSVADMKNVGGGGEAGSIVAGLFLEAFVDGVPWAHLDIAGTAFAERELPYSPRGATGFGVRLLVQYLRDLA